MRLLALEFAVKDSHEDRFAQQLEPALGHLAADIRTGFQLTCWMHSQVAFRHAAPQGINLEQDIADLEARMDAVGIPASVFRRPRFCAPMRCNCI